MSVQNRALDEGWQRERAGDLAGAEVAYRTVVAQDARSGESWFRLGIVCLKQRILPEAVSCMQEARALGHKPAETLNLQGVALAWMGQPQQAENLFRHAIGLSPRYADAYVNHGSALRELGRLQEAVTSLFKGVELAPNNIGAMENLAAVYRLLHQDQEAMECLQRILQLQPDNVAALISISSLRGGMGQVLQAEQGYRRAIQLAPNNAEAYVGLGVLLAEHRHFEEARDLLQRATQLDRNSAQAFSNLGNAQRELGLFAEARVSLERALEIDPKHVPALHNLGKLFFDLNDFAHATEHYNQALRCDPEYMDSKVGLGSVYAMQGKYADATKCFQQALSNRSQVAQTSFNLALIQLLHGDWEQGLREYEWRLQTSSFVPRDFSQPMWDGAEFKDQTVLLHCEQGLGDTLLFCRYVELVKQRGGQVILEAPNALLPILQSCSGFDELIAAGDALPRFDFHAPLLSLPRIFGSTPTSVPHRIPYLHPEVQRLGRWKREFSGGDVFRIGIVWRGNPDYRGDKNRSIPLASFEPLAAVDRVQLFSLQKGSANEEIAGVANKFSVIDLGVRLDQTGGAFLDTAAVMKCLDLVVSIDSAPAHLAGALGVTVWLALSRVADWRWLLDRDDSVWYRTMRLFRQTKDGDWSDVMVEMSRELKNLRVNCGDCCDGYRPVI